MLSSREFLPSTPMVAKVFLWVLHNTQTSPLLFSILILHKLLLLQNSVKPDDFVVGLNFHFFLSKYGISLEELETCQIRKKSLKVVCHGRNKWKRTNLISQSTFFMWIKAEKIWELPYPTKKKSPFLRKGRFLVPN